MAPNPTHFPLFLLELTVDVPLKGMLMVLLVLGKRKHKQNDKCKIQGRVSWDYRHSVSPAYWELTLSLNWVGKQKGVCEGEGRLWQVQGRCLWRLSADCYRLEAVGNRSAFGHSQSILYKLPGGLCSCFCLQGQDLGPCKPLQEGLSGWNKIHHQSRAISFSKSPVYWSGICFMLVYSWIVIFTTNTHKERINLLTFRSLQKWGGKKRKVRNWQ